MFLLILYIFLGLVLVPSLNLEGYQRVTGGVVKEGVRGIIDWLGYVCSSLTSSIT